MQAFEHQDVWPPYHLELVLDDVVTKMGVPRDGERCPTCLERAQERDQPFVVVGLGKPLAPKEAAVSELGVGQQEAVGGNHLDTWLEGELRELPGEVFGPVSTFRHRRHLSPRRRRVPSARRSRASGVLRARAEQTASTRAATSFATAAGRSTVP